MAGPVTCKLLVTSSLCVGWLVFLQSLLWLFQMGEARVSRLLSGYAWKSEAARMAPRKPKSPVSPLLGRKYGPFQPPARQIELKVKQVDCLHKEFSNKRAQTTYTHMCQFPEAGFPHSS